MKEVYGTFIECIDRTETVKSFRFSFDEEISFLPGQFMQLIFDESNRTNLDLNKYLSLSSAPQAAYVEVTKRVSSSNFSARLCNLKKGDRLLFKAPLGNCVYHDDYPKIAFLIGGIGITPVISILEYMKEKGLQTDTLLIYSNRFENDMAFRSEIDDCKKSNPHLQVFHTLTECDPKDDQCLTGFINQEMIVQIMPDWQDRIIFVYGSPGMVKTIKSICSDLTCDTSKLKTEGFMGY